MLDSKQSSPKEKPLAWAERPSKELLSLAWPIAVSFLSYSTMSLVDTIFVGRLGAPALAGVALGTTSSFALLVFAFGLLRGVKVRVSMAVGAGRSDEASAYLQAGMWIGVAIGVVVVALSFFVSPLLGAISASYESGQYASLYLRIRLLGAPAVLVFVALREYRYGINDSRWPMIAAVVANVANIGLDFLFVVVLDYGVAGAAWATVVGQCLQLGVLLLHQKRLSRLRRAGLRHIRDILDVGLATGVQFFLEMGSFTMLSFLIASLSDVEMAAHQIGVQILHFTFLPAVAMGEAASVLAGQAVGAGRYELVRTVAKRAVIVTTMYSIACVATLVAFGRPLSEIFTEDQAVIDTAVVLLFAAAIFQMADAAGVVASSTLRGVGDVKFAALVGTGCAWMLTPPLTYLLGHALGLGALGGWIGLCLEIMLAATLYWQRLNSQRWRMAAQRQAALT